MRLRKTQNEQVLMVLLNKFDTILVEDIGYKPDITRIQKALWAIPEKTRCNYLLEAGSVAPP